MRLIDADHLKSMLQEYIKREQAYIDIGNNKIIAIGHSNGLWEAIAQIDEEPTIESQKMCGRWERIILGTSEFGTVMYRCSICEKLSISMHEFCPHCGAMMEEQNG